MPFLPPPTMWSRISPSWRGSVEAAAGGAAVGLLFEPGHRWAKSPKSRDSTWRSTRTPSLHLGQHRDQRALHRLVDTWQGEARLQRPCNRHATSACSATQRPASSMPTWARKRGFAAAGQRLGRRRAVVSAGSSSPCSCSAKDVRAVGYRPAPSAKCVALGDETAPFTFSPNLHHGRVFEDRAEQRHRFRDRGLALGALAEAAGAGDVAERQVRARRTGRHADRLAAHLISIAERERAAPRITSSRRRGRRRPARKSTGRVGQCSASALGASPAPQVRGWRRCRKGGLHQRRESRQASGSRLPGPRAAPRAARRGGASPGPATTGSGRHARSAPRVASAV